MTLELLLIIAFGGAFFSYFLGKVSFRLRNFFAVFISCILVIIVAFFYKNSLERFRIDFFM